MIGVIGVGQDLTDARIAQLESERIAAELTQFIDTANAPIFGIDADGLINEWNQTAAEITGFKK
ncbi:MAG TPA: PAS domain-containing protein, partial [Gammaproteobacteria bacterium]|nr:PAS domain-containing protein [Gammaproteobacteria bacterium]